MKNDFFNHTKVMREHMPKEEIPLSVLKGKFKGKEYEEYSKDVEYLKRFLSRIHKNGGTGFITRLELI